MAHMLFLFERYQVEYLRIEDLGCSITIMLITLLTQIAVMKESHPLILH
jgi:hypothetical protein